METGKPRENSQLSRHPSPQLFPWRHLDSSSASQYGVVVVVLVVAVVSAVPPAAAAVAADVEETWAVEVAGGWVG